MFTNRSFTENKAVINGEMVRMCCSISHPRFNISKNPSVTRFGADCLTPSRILKIKIVGLQMDSGYAIMNCNLLKSTVLFR